MPCRRVSDPKAPQRERQRHSTRGRLTVFKDTLLLAGKVEVGLHVVWPECASDSFWRCWIRIDGRHLGSCRREAGREGLALTDLKHRRWHHGELALETSTCRHLHSHLGSAVFLVPVAPVLPWTSPSARLTDLTACRSALLYSATSGLAYRHSDYHHVSLGYCTRWIRLN